MSLMQKINAIASAVQEVSGEDTPLTLDQMPAKIRSAAGGSEPITFGNSQYEVTINLQKLKTLLQNVGFDLNESFGVPASDASVVSIGFGIPVYNNTVFPYGYYSSGDQTYQYIAGPSRRLFSLEIDTNSLTHLFGYCGNYFEKPSSVEYNPSTFDELFTDFASVSPETFTMHDYRQSVNLADIILFPLLIIDNGDYHYTYPISNTQLEEVFHISPSK